MSCRSIHITRITILYYTKYYASFMIPWGTGKAGLANIFRKKNHQKNNWTGRITKKKKLHFPQFLFFVRVFLVGVAVAFSFFLFTFCSFLFLIFCFFFCSGFVLFFVKPSILCVAGVIILVTQI